MRLVDDEQRDAQAAQLVDEALVGEPFGGDVEEFQIARAQIGVDAAVFLDRDARIQPGGRDAARVQEVDLVFHQRDERRDDQRQAVEVQRGKLVAEAFAAAGGEDGERGPAIENGFNDPLLPLAESGEPENVVEGLLDGRSCGMEERTHFGKWAAFVQAPNARTYCANEMVDSAVRS